MKKFAKLFITATMTASVLVSSMQMAFAALDVKIIDPASHSFPINQETITNYKNGSNSLYMEADYIASGCSNLSYGTDTTYIGKNGFIRHTSGNNESGTMWFNCGEPTQNGFTADNNGDQTRAHFPGSLSKYKGEVVFRINSQKTSTTSGLFSFRHFYIDGEGNGASKLLGVQGASSVTNNKYINWWGSLESGKDGTQLGNSESNGVVLGKWYRYTCGVDLLNDYYYYKLEVIDDNSGVATPVRTIDQRICSTQAPDGKGIYCMLNSMRVGFEKVLDFDIAEMKVTRDNLVLLKQPDSNLKSGEDNTGVITNFNINNNDPIVARTYVRSNAIGENGTGGYQNFFLDRDGDGVPCTVSPSLMVVQYDNDGKILKVDIEGGKDMPPLNAGYRGSEYVYMNPKLEVAPETANYDYEVLLQKELADAQTLEIRAEKADGVKTAKIFLLRGLASGDTTPYIEMLSHTYQ